jgi:predicted molibdopterin-dependent oxidoreductase YjgC
MRCDCRKSGACALRDLADEFGIGSRRQPREERMPFERNLEHPQIVFEPGKCIKCGRCLRIAERGSEPLGIAFSGRGYPTRVAVPFGRSLAAGLSRTARECIAACPTGALAARG